MFSNIALSFGKIHIYWYGINYAFSILIGYVSILFFGKYFFKNFNVVKEDLLEIYLYSIFFGLIGGRLFHIIFYELNYYVNNPTEIYMFWKGGMSIHGGILFGLISIYYFSKKRNINFLKFTDLLVIPLSFALSLGRITNFINQELVGKITNSNFGIIFPKVDNNLRYPSQLFESFKNLLTFEILIYLLYFKNYNKKEGYLTANFLIIYNFGRYFVDFFREPETIFLGIISMSQLLSLIFGFFGIILLIYLIKKEKNKFNKN